MNHNSLCKLATTGSLDERIIMTKRQKRILMTKLLFMGTPQFSATVLKGLLENPNYEILAVVTQPDRAVGRKKKSK